MKGKLSSNSSGDESVAAENKPAEMPTSTLEKRPPKAASPGVVSSSLTGPKERLLNKSLEMLRQIFPGKPTKVLEVKLREAKGDVVKALEACAKHFDQKPATPTSSSVTPFVMTSINGSSHQLHQQENNNNPFLPPNICNDSKFVPPFSTAAMLAFASNHHKSAFMPASNHAYFRGFDAAAAAAASAAPQHHSLFPFPPPLFPPNFFVGFGANPLNLSNAAAIENGSLSISNHRPCVDPVCNQCAPKADSTAMEDSSKDEDEL